MEMANLPFAKVETFAKVCGGCQFNSLLKIIRDPELLDGELFGVCHLLLQLCDRGIPVLGDLLQLLGDLLLLDLSWGQLFFHIASQLLGLCHLALE